MDNDSNVDPQTDDGTRTAISAPETVPAVPQGCVMTPSEPMPAGLVHVRKTPEFSDTTVPAGLLASHRLAPDVWGRLRISAGALRFVFEADPADARELSAGYHVDIPPDVAHHMEPRPGARFVAEFHRAQRG